MFFLWSSALKKIKIIIWLKLDEWILCGGSLLPLPVLFSSQAANGQWYEWTCLLHLFHFPFHVTSASRKTSGREKEKDLPIFIPPCLHSPAVNHFPPEHKVTATLRQKTSMEQETIPASHIPEPGRRSIISYKTTKCSCGLHGPQKPVSWSKAGFHTLCSLDVSL